MEVQASQEVAIQEAVDPGQPERISFGYTVWDVTLQGVIVVIKKDSIRFFNQDGIEIKSPTDNTIYRAGKLHTNVEHWKEVVALQTKQKAMLQELRRDMRLYIGLEMFIDRHFNSVESLESQLRFLQNAIDTAREFIEKKLK